MSKKLKCIFTKKFLDTMYENMWTFINPDTIQHMFPNLQFSYLNDIWDENIPQEYSGTICFKGEIEDGHYIYVSKNTNKGFCIPLGSYESNILTRPEDDGVCHGVAICYYLFYSLNDKRFELLENPNNEDTIYRKNYKTILELYIYLIESGKWDNALRDNFYYNLDWDTGDTTTEQTHIALDTLKEYIKRF
jgi:hypothetical protein